MYKEAELYKISTLYNACKGVLRVKLAKAEEEYDDYEEPDTMTAGTAMEDAGRNLMEHYTGGPQFNQWGAWGGNLLSRMGSGIYNSFAKGLANSEGGFRSWLGNLLLRHKQDLSEVAGGWGHNLNNQWRTSMRDKRIKEEMAKKGIDPNKRKIDPDAMFMNLFNQMAFAGQRQNAMYNPYMNGYR